MGFYPPVNSSIKTAQKLGKIDGRDCKSACPQDKFYLDIAQLWDVMGIKTCASCIQDVHLYECHCRRHLEGPAARVVRGCVVAHGVVVAHEPVLLSQIHAPPRAAVAPLAGRIVAQEMAAYNRLGIREAAARAARRHLCTRLHSVLNSVRLETNDSSLMAGLH